MSKLICTNIDEFDDVFQKGPDGLLTGSARQKLCEKFWCQDSFKEYISPSNRCIYWRYLFGIISRTDQKLWLNELMVSVEEYSEFKTSIFPSISNVGFDPLSDENPDTLSYFESVEKVKSIELDLNRLYINGIEEEYFQTKRRNRILQSVLLIWSVQNPTISYRQGMHEIVGTIMFCLERELEAWSSLQTDHFLRAAFNEDSIEAHTYWLFKRVLDSLGALYDPTLLPPTDTNTNNSANGHRSSSIEMDQIRRGNRDRDRRGSNNGVPRAVLYLMDFQGTHLRHLDADLWTHLTNLDIHPQFYGLRWSRLLLGREFSFSNTHLLRIWDCLFYAAGETGGEAEREGEEGGKEGGQRGVAVPVGFVEGEESMTPAGDSPSQSSTLGGHVRKKDKGSPVPASYPPMMKALREFMLAMLVHMRAELLAGDSSATLGLLMKFPEMLDLSPIFSIISDVRSGKRPLSSSITDLKDSENIFPEPTAESIMMLNRTRQEESWSDPVPSPSPSAPIGTLLSSLSQSVSPPFANLADIPSFFPPPVLSQRNIPIPSAWLSALDFKNMSIPSLSSFHPQTQAQAQTGAVSASTPHAKRESFSNGVISGSMEGQGQEMESSVPFLSPFPSINSSQSTSSGTLIPAPIPIPIQQHDSDRTEHPHSSQAAQEKGGGEREGGGGESDECLFEVDIDRDIGGRDLEPIPIPEPGPIDSTQRDASAAHLTPPAGERGCDSVDPAATSPVCGVAATDCRAVAADETEMAPGVAGSSHHDRAGPADPLEHKGINPLENKGFAKVSSRFSSSLDFLLGESSSSSAAKKGKARAVDLRDLKGSPFATSPLPLRSRDAAVADGDDLEGYSTVTLTSTAPLHPSSTSTSTSVCTSASKEVGDRLLRIAEDLLSVKHALAHSKDVGGETETSTLSDSLKAESRLRTDTAKKLLLLSKILSGRASIEEYSALN